MWQFVLRYDFIMRHKKLQILFSCFNLVWPRLNSFYARKQNASRVFAIVWASVCLSVCLSHSWTVSKRCKLGSRNLHCGLPQVSSLSVRKFRATGCRGSPRTRASKRGTPLKRRHFAVIGSNNVKTVADRYIHAAYHNKHWWQAFWIYQHRW